MRLLGACSLDSRELSSALSFLVVGLLREVGRIPCPGRGLFFLFRRRADIPKIIADVVGAIMREERRARPFGRPWLPRWLRSSREPIRRKSYMVQSRAASHALNRRGIRPAPLLSLVSDAGGDAPVNLSTESLGAVRIALARWRLKVPALCSKRTKLISTTREPSFC